MGADEQLGMARVPIRDERPVDPLATDLLRIAAGNEHLEALRRAEENSTRALPIEVATFQFTIVDSR
jgi:hypothetical protein